MDELTLGQARRLAVVAQGLGRPRPPQPVGLRQVRATAERLGVLQIDSVSVVARAHFLPLWSRLGDYDVGLLDRLAYPRRPAERRLFETWAHEASYVPVGLEPLLRWRKARWSHARPRPDGADAALDAVRAGGPLAASDLEARTGAGGWWNWSGSKRTLEWLFGAGELQVARRRPSFEREYDVPERVLPAEVLAAPTPQESDARKALLLQAAGVLGVAAAADLMDWWRLNRPLTRPLLRELEEDGALHRVTVRGWAEPAYVMPGTVLPRSVGGAALLAPFDGLVFHRPRVERLWGIRMRLEIYTPAARRVHGYYVLPFLLGDRLAARVDLKSDRAAGVLRVLAAHAEVGEVPGAVAEPLAVELAGMAAWLGLSGVKVRDRGDLAPALTAAVPAAAVAGAGG